MPSGGPRGIPIDFRRQKTAKQRLSIEWTYPVWAPDLEREVDDGRTVSGRALVALPRDEAIAAIRAPDRRPLLVVRECNRCQGTDDALLSRRLDNERTALLTQWFRCIKLPTHVLQPEHPFRNLFPEEHPPHLFLCRYDGTGVVELSGEQTQAELWEAMTALIGLEYSRDVARALKELARVLNDYDTLDSREDELTRQLEEALDEKGPDDPRVKSLRAKLAQIDDRRAKVAEHEKRVRDLGLKDLPPAGGER